MVQWLGLHASTAGGPGSIPGQRTKVPQAAWRGLKKKFSLLVHKTEEFRLGFLFPPDPSKPGQGRILPLHISDLKSTLRVGEQ